MHVLETSVFTRLHRDQVHEEVQQLPPEELARSVVTGLELGFSARTPDEWDRTAQMLSALAELPLTADVVDRAKQVQRELAGRGLRGRKIPDLLIAATAELSEATLVHYDKDFELIASVTGQPHQWVVARGTID